MRIQFYGDSIKSYKIFLFAPSPSVYCQYSQVIENILD